MKNNFIEFRQAIFIHGKFNSWHYWGFNVNGQTFVSPQCSNNPDAAENSYQFTNAFVYWGDNETRLKLYGGDILFEYPGKYWRIYWDDQQWCIETKTECKSLFDGLQQTSGNMLSKVGNVVENPELLAYF